jgi:hypothetical protein
MKAKKTLFTNYAYFSAKATLLPVLRNSVILEKLKQH